MNRDPLSMELPDGASGIRPSGNSADWPGKPIAEDPLPDFRGKLLVVYFKGAGAQAAAPVGEMLSSPIFKTHGGRLFLVGDMARVDAPSWHGASKAIAWDCIEAYIVLDSLDDYQSRQAPFQKPPPRGWFS